MNIVLIGYRGTGKSEVGAIVANRLKMTCIGMDAEIVRQAKMSIPEIVEKSGWPVSGIWKQPWQRVWQKRIN